jgi:SAM-dependent methyltransferase
MAKIFYTMVGQKIRETYHKRAAPMNPIFNRYRKSAPFEHLSPLQRQVKAEVMAKVDSGAYRFEGGPCCVCRGERFLKVSEVDSFGIPTPVALCKSCGLLQTNPHFDERSYADFYQRDFFQLYKNMVAPTDEYLEAKKKSGEKIYKFLEAQGLLPAKGSLVLEVGCGTGAGLTYFRDQGYQIVGCDLSREIIEKGRERYDLPLFAGTLAELSLERRPDLVIYCHVFEHLVDPYKELAMLERHLNPETLIYIEMPGLKKDFGNKLRFLKGAHVFHFSRRSLENMLGKAGFALVSGDESIRAVFRRRPGFTFDLKNDYSAALYYLIRSELTFRLKGLVKRTRR